jgi:hypothetical protein
MSTTDYLINGLIVVLVLRQMHDRRLDLRSALLPLGLVIGIGQQYLTTIPSAGNDLVLIIGLSAIGITLGALSGLATSVRAGDDGHAIARVGWRAAGLLLVGLLARVAFVFAANNGAGHAIASFSASSHITAAAWPAALVLMAVLEVLVRVAVVQYRGHQVMSREEAPQLAVA